LRFHQVKKHQGTNRQQATCKTCNAVGLMFPVSLRPKTFMKSKPHQSDKSGYFDFRQFEKHEVTKGHDWASERRSGHALTVAGLFKK